MSGLDCEFEDCTKKAEPKVVVKEKIVYRDRPVEKVVVKEKIVYRDRPVVQEKVVYRDRPAAKVAKKETPAVAGRTYNKLFIDVSAPGDPTFLSDYILRTQRASGLDWNPILKKIASGPKKGSYSVKISGMIELPEGITADKIYIKPTMKTMTKYLVIGGHPWTTQEFILDNAYKNDRTIPFYYNVKMRSYSDRGDFVSYITGNLTDLHILVSNKPTQRGEKKEFRKTRVFINE